MTTTFTLRDAYCQWLGIPPDEMPPNHYGLLGIAALESDTRAILTAGSERTRLASGHLQGPHAEVARRLLGELAAAQACLLNPDAKAAYDRELAARLGNLPAAGSAPFKRPAPRSRSEAAAIAPMGIAVGASGSEGPLAGDVAAPPLAEGDLTDGNGEDFRDPAGLATALPWLLGGVCAGLVGVCILALVLFARPAAQTVAVPPTDAGSRQVPALDASQAQHSRERSPRRGGIPRPSADDAQVSVPPTTPAGTSVDLRWDDDAPPAAGSGELLSVDDLDGDVPIADTGTREMPSTGDPLATAAVSTAPPAAAGPLERLPRAVKLPLRKKGDDAVPGPVVLTRLDVDDSQPVSLRLASSRLPGGRGRYELLERPSGPDGGPRMWDVQYTPADGEGKIVGAYELADGELSFAWSPDAPADEAAQLQNYPLQITAGEQSTTLAQRTPDDHAPLVVKFDSGAISTTAAIDTPPEDARMYVAIDELDNMFPAHQWAPDSTIEVGKQTDLRFGSPSDPYQVALRITAEQVGPNRVRVEARPMFRQGESQKWELFRPKSAAQELGQLKQQELILDGQMDQLRRRFRRDPAALQQAAAAINQQASSLQQRVATLERINADCQALQEKGELHFRLFAKNGDHEIDLVRTTKDETAAPEPPKREIDPNIGAPVKAEENPPPEPADE